MKTAHILGAGPENRYARRAGNEPYYFCDRRFLRAWRGSSEAFELCAQFFENDISASVDAGYSAGTDLPELPH